jgi:hypothetical protein
VLLFVVDIANDCFNRHRLLIAMTPTSLHVRRESVGRERPVIGAKAAASCGAVFLFDTFGSQFA